VHQAAPAWGAALAGQLSAEAPTLRLPPQPGDAAAWEEEGAPLCRQAAGALAELSTALGALLDLLDTVPPGVRMDRPQPYFDLQRARRRVGEQAAVLAEVAEGADGRIRWLEAERGRGRAEPRAAALTAPIEVGPMLRARLFDPLAAVVATSATLRVDGGFAHWLERVGWPEAAGAPAPSGDPATGFPLALEERPWAPDPPAEALPRTGTWDSPFDYARQGLLGVPRDLPAPDAPGFAEAVATLTHRALRAAGGGAFVLCTSHHMVEDLHGRVGALLQQDGGPRLALMRQGSIGRDRLLADFRRTGDAVLFGTDSFWEGVSVKGRALRLVVIPRLPFRVPTEPIQQARYERLAATGRDPFRGYALPQAVLRLRQGVGRLIRTERDRGAVLVLDRRVSERWYGRVFLQSLPPFRRVVGPGRLVLEALEALYAGR
jgi:ATP-dependent DNA helicase DinG